MAENGPLTGRTFSTRYQLGERIGAGGMAEVYSATDLVLGRTVAVKVMLPQFAQDPEFTRRFRQEAAAAANLQSPYIVNVYDWGHDDDTYYIVMEFVRGSDLKSAIIERGAINQRKVAEIGSQVCQALTVAHQQDIIHRDVKPQNIMVQPDGNVKVMDFGIARAKNSTAEKTQTVLGTAHYTSPEQAQGHDLTAASDIYSLGVVLYEAATGKLPFDGPDAVSVALMQVKDEPPAPRSINPDIDPSFEAIILTAMAKDPRSRFATANDMRIALNDYLAGRPINLGALVAGGAAAVVATAAADAFAGARTSVITPIGAAAGDMDSTQVMPVSGVNNIGNTAAYGGVRGSSGNGATRRYQDNQQAKGGAGKTIAVVVAIIAVIAAVVGVLFFTGVIGGEKLSVPDVTGLKTENAVTLIEDAGFKVGRMESTVDDSVEPGTVVSQDPKAKTMANKGSAINIKVSQGTEQVEIPNVTDKTEGEAKTLLMRAGFILGDVKDEPSETVEAGKIISQSPSANSKAAKGSRVSIVVSKGADEVDVPNLVGKTESDAKEAAQKAGFTASESDSQYSDSITKGSVVSQSPSAGSKAKKGTTISYVISLGPDIGVTVPDLTGASESYAVNTLENLGLTVSVVQNYSKTVPKGTVIQQNVVGKATKGETVTIEVSLGPSPSEDPQAPSASLS